jgi:uncharacterized protein
MPVKIQKPILFIGVSLSFTLYALSSLNDSILHHSGEFAVLTVMALGLGLWLLPSQGIKTVNLPSQINQETVKKAIAEVEVITNLIKTENSDHPEIANLTTKITELTTGLNRQNITIAITGAKSSGKSSLLNLLTEKQPTLSIIETPALFNDIQAENIAYQQAIAADLVLFLVPGDLTETEYQFWQKLTNLHQRIVVVFNKQDQYLPADQPVIFTSIKNRVKEVVATSTNPTSIKVRTEQEDGTIQERLEQPPINIDSLILRVNEIITQEQNQLTLATTWREVLTLKNTAKNVLNEIRKTKALPIIEQYQWIAAGTALANPIAALDLLATMAINGQMLADLGEIYQQKLSLEQAKTGALTLGNIMLKLGLVEISTNTIVHLLKTNAVTYLAGGLVQGISAAYLTRVAGLSLIEYLETQEIGANTNWNWSELTNTIKSVFEQNQRTAFLQSFLQQTLSKINPKLSLNQG